MSVFSRFVLIPILLREGDEFELEELFFMLVFGVEVDFFLMSVFLIDGEAVFFFVVIFRDISLVSSLDESLHESN